MVVMRGSNQENLYFNASDPLGELWRRAWVIPAFWTLLAYALLIVICILWAPSRNPTRYSYSEETGDDFDEEAVTIVESGVKVSEMATRLERKDRKASSTSLATDHHVFGVVEEEDKRE